MRQSLQAFSQDRSVVDHRLAPGTIRRIGGFARPYRRAIAIFLVLIVIDAVAGAATPLIYRSIIDQGIQQGRTGLVVALAGLVAALGHPLGRHRPGPALVLLADRRGPHQRPAHPGLRPRPADAHRLLQPGPDRCPRVPPQQRRPGCPAGVHVDALQRRRQPRRRRRHARRDVRAVVADHAAGPRPAPPVRAAHPLGRQPPGRHHPGALPPQRRDGPDDDGALQRLRRPARQALRPPRVRSPARSPGGPVGSATSASRPPCTRGS